MISRAGSRVGSRARSRTRSRARSRAWSQAVKHDVYLPRGSCARWRSSTSPSRRSSSVSTPPTSAHSPAPAPTPTILDRISDVCDSHEMGLLAGRGQRSMQIKGLRIPCALLQGGVVDTAPGFRRPARPERDASRCARAHPTIVGGYVSRQRGIEIVILKGAQVSRAPRTPRAPCVTPCLHRLAPSSTHYSHCHHRQLQSPSPQPPLLQRHFVAVATSFTAVTLAPTTTRRNHHHPAPSPHVTHAPRHPRHRHRRLCSAASPPSS